MSETRTCRCGCATANEAYTCGDCLDGLARDLGEMPWLDDQLDITITRQRGAATTGGSQSTETPLPWHDKASEAQRALHSTMATWVRFCNEERVRYTGRGGWPEDTIPAMSRWLMRRVDGLAFHELGYDLIDELEDAAAEGRRIVFWKRAARQYLGPCDGTDNPVEHDPIACTCRCHDGYGHACATTAGCGTEATEHVDCDGDVYADPDEDVGYCEACATAYSVTVRRQKMEAELDDKLMTAAEIARVSTYLGLDVPRERVRKQVNTWHTRRQVSPAGHDEAGDPRFRYGAVKSLLYATYAQRDTA